VSRLNREQEAVRAKIAEWVRYYRKRYARRYPQNKAFADYIGISASHLSNILNRKRTPGWDVAEKLSALFHIEINRITKDDPEDLETGIEPPSLPAPASPSAAKPGRRRTGGGGP
jgi:transcriptional regulator with XRE-family HTH domain